MILTEFKGKKKILFFIRIRKGSIFEQHYVRLKTTKTVVLLVNSGFRFGLLEEDIDNLSFL